jgi:PPOX class probable F420-dependent enzyme
VTPAWVDDALRSARVARLATAAGDGVIRMVPICFAVLDGTLVSAVDHKPKRTGQLRRLDDITATGTATVLIDHYAEDWTQLWWVRVRGAASVLSEGEWGSALAVLAEKYEQYRAITPRGPVYRVAMDELRWWRSTPNS